MFELFIARRYLRAKRKQVMISVITTISVVGVAAGVMALVVALAINNGFRNTLQRSFLAATAHVMVLEKVRSEGISNWESMTGKLAALPNVKSVTPALYDLAYLSGPIESFGVQVKGVSVDRTSDLPDPLRQLKEGSLANLKSADGPQGIILGSSLAKKIGAVVGKNVRIMIPNGNITAFGPRPSFEDLKVAGVFETGVFDVDSTWTFMALPAMQKVFGYADIVNGIEMNLDDIYKAPEVAKAAESVIGKDFEATTWQQQNRQILDAFRMERVVTVVTIGLIQLVAALNILIALVMMVMEKHRDIAVLMSMGARSSQIRRIFIFKGALIGAVGTTVGLVIGYALSFLADRYQWLKLDQEVYAFKYVPLEPHLSDAIWISAAAMAVSLLATVYPARTATKIAPVESMRYE
ncbi:MAG: FtsX-like permease family protein [Acidobacteriota bacterium]